MPQGNQDEDSLDLQTSPGDLRAKARELRQVMDQALKTASELPPLWGITAQEQPQPCASCGAEAVSYKLIEGERVYICGPCSLREMDEWEATHGDL